MTRKEAEDLLTTGPIGVLGLVSTIAGAIVMSVVSYFQHRYYMIPVWIVGMAAGYFFTNEFAWRRGIAPFLWSNLFKDDRTKR